jgi:hypothetical protein
MLPEEKQLNYLPSNYSPNSETVTVTVTPCGSEDGKNSIDEMPYEMKIRRKGNFTSSSYLFLIIILIVNENSLKEIFSQKNSLWEKIFK